MKVLLKNGLRTWNFKVSLKETSNIEFVLENKLECSNKHVWCQLIYFVKYEYSLMKYTFWLSPLVMEVLSMVK